MKINNYSFKNKDFYLLLLALFLAFSFYNYDQELNWSVANKRILFTDFFYSPSANYSIPIEGFSNVNCKIYMDILPGHEFDFKNVDVKAFAYSVKTSLKDDKNNLVHETSSKCCADNTSGISNIIGQEKRIRIDLIRDWKFKDNTKYKVEIMFQSNEPMFENKYVEIVVDRYTNAERALGFLILKISVIISLLLIILILVYRQYQLYVASSAKGMHKKL